MLPATVLETPYELSFIAIFDDESKELIWHKTVDTNMDASLWPEVMQKIETNRANQNETDVINGESGTYNNTIDMDSGEFYKTWQVPSPLNDINHHVNYNPDYKMIVVCG